MEENFNPYAAPQSNVLQAHESAGHFPLASRWKRLGGIFLDGLIGAIVVLPIQFLTGNFQQVIEQSRSGQRTMFTFQGDQILWSLLGLGVMLAINWHFLAKGQTIGKMIVKTRIVLIDGSPCDRSRIILRRMLPLHIAQQIPVVNLLFGLTDMFMIFRENRRTLHDEIAGTKVIDISRDSVA
jgi:uncharacterized RDD family membrane protein YckC